jgi:hypothetical protein
MRESIRRIRIVPCAGANTVAFRRGLRNRYLNAMKVCTGFLVVRRIEANQVLLEPLLGQLGVIAGFRPLACAPQSGQTQP